MKRTGNNENQRRDPCAHKGAPWPPERDFTVIKRKC